jgi:SAM-dependent methyltransferase
VFSGVTGCYLSIGMFGAKNTGPETGTPYDDPGYVWEQYRDASKLGARTALHGRFSTNRRPWQRWVFDRFDLPAEARILEVGCGPGNLWAENLDRLPPGWSVTLTDASPGMIRSARDRLAYERFRFGLAGAQQLPFEDGVFDAVVANHLLYHVRDRGRAIAEISRVLGPAGVLYAATNGRDHNREMGRMLHVLFPDRPDGGYHQARVGFSLENGRGQLSRRFGDVRLLRREDSLFVTEVRPLLDYLLSGTAAHAAGGDGEVAALSGVLERELASRGGIRIRKDTGMFAARR